MTASVGQNLGALRVPRCWPQVAAASSIRISGVCDERRGQPPFSAIRHKGKKLGLRFAGQVPERGRRPATEYFRNRCHATQGWSSERAIISSTHRGCHSDCRPKEQCARAVCAARLWKRTEHWAAFVVSWGRVGCAMLAIGRVLRSTRTPTVANLRGLRPHCFAVYARFAGCSESAADRRGLAGE